MNHTHNQHSWLLWWYYNNEDNQKKPSFSLPCVAAIERSKESAFAIQNYDAIDGTIGEGCFFLK
jgi:hypothetical protein